MRSNKVEESTSIGPHCTTHDTKVPFFMPEFSIRNMISYRFNVDNNEGESGIGYDIIIERGLIVQLGLLDDFKHQFLQWYGATVIMKEPIGLLGKIDLISRKINEVVMNTTEKNSTRESTHSLVELLRSNYAKEYLEQVAANTTHLNAEYITQLLILLEDFEDFFGGTLGDWDTEPADLELNPDSKPFYCKHYTVPRIKKENY